MNTALSFYSSELTSHAALAIAFGVAFLTVVQVGLSFSNPSSISASTTSPPSTAFDALIIPMTIVIAGGAYSLLRVTVYAGLADTLFHGYFDDFNDFWTHPPQNERRRLPLARANEYALHVFDQRHPRLRHFYNYKRPGTWLIPLISFAISYLFLFYLILPR